MSITVLDDLDKFWNFFPEKRSYAAAMNVFISVLKYANKWMRVCKSKRQGEEVAAEF